jgi:hypothetical protein
MIRLALTAFLLLSIAPPALAWGALGHRLVASLAEEELSPVAKAEVARLLQGEPEATLAGVSTWADELRAKDPGLGRRSAAWHYVNIAEDGCDYDADRNCNGADCVVEAIREQAAILADVSEPVATRRRALKFVVHFVGDVHQPMHAGYARDKGGNTVQVRLPGPRGGSGSNLHALWDSGLLRAAGLDEPAYLERLRALPLAVVAMPGLPPPSADWAEQSCALATAPGVYPQRPQLDPGYMERWTPVADEQLRRGGARLAQVLNAALDPR